MDEEEYERHMGFKHHTLKMPQPILSNSAGAEYWGPDYESYMSYREEVLNYRRGETDVIPSYIFPKENIN